MKLTPHEEKILELVRKYPQIVNDHTERTRVAQEYGYTEKTLRNRIGDLKKYGVIEGDQIESKSDTQSVTNINTDIKNDQASHPKPKELNLIDLLLLLFDWKKPIIAIVSIITLLSVVFSLIVPKTFTSQTLIIPSGYTGIGQQIISTFSMDLLSGSSSQNEMDLLVAILKSRTMMDSVVNKFDLINQYEVKNIEEAVIILRENVSITEQDEETLLVSVGLKTGFLSSEEEDDKIRSMVAKMVNFIIIELDRMNKRIKTQQAGYNRLFIENRFYENMEYLKEIENGIRNYQKDNKLTFIPKQIEASITFAAEIKAKIIIAEVELNSLKNDLNIDNPKIIRLQNQIEEYRSALDQMLYETVDDNDHENIFVKLVDIPDININYIRSIRELEAQGKLYEFLLQQFEQAKIEEAKETPTLQILDVGVIPIKRSKPKRTLIVISTFILSIIMTSVSIVILNNIKNSL